MISTILGDIAAGVGSFLPTMAGALFEAFLAMFFVTAEGGSITGLNALGEVSLAFMIVGLSIKFLPTVAGWLKTKWKSRGRRARRAK